MTSRRLILSLVPLLFLGPAARAAKNVIRAQNKREYRLSVQCEPRSSLRAPYTDINQFWTDHGDPVARRLNREFKADGRILRMNSELSADGKSAILTKVYASYEDYLEFQKSWIAASENFERREAQLIKYSPSHVHTC